MSIDIKIPPLGESIQEATLSQLLKKTGDFVEESQAIAEIESDKASLTIVAPASGVITYLKNVGDVLPIETVFAKIEEKILAQEEKKEIIKNEVIKEVILSPAAKKKSVEENKIPLGTGKDGRVLKQDFLSVKEEVVVQKNDLKKEPLTKLRKTIAERMLKAKNEQALLTTFNEVDLLEIQKIRKDYKELLEKKYGFNIGYMSFFAQAICESLKEFPIIQAQLKEDHILYFQDVHLGIAVSTERGLMVPVIRKAQEKSLLTLEKEIKSLAERARNQSLLPGDLQGATFTITNGGVFGSLLSTPIVSPPQSAILGMHTIQERPVVRNGQIVIRPMMYIALTYDHRLIDGKDSVSFLKTVKEKLEDPVRLMLDI